MTKAVLERHHQKFNYSGELKSTTNNYIGVAVDKDDNKKSYVYSVEADSRSFAEFLIYKNFCIPYGLKLTHITVDRRV